LAGYADKPPGVGSAASQHAGYDKDHMADCTSLRTELNATRSSDHICWESQFLGHSLIIRQLAEIEQTRPFEDLWLTLNNDRLFDLCHIHAAGGGRNLDPLVKPFRNTTAEDWVP
jgi:hypothetical protein